MGEISFKFELGDLVEDTITKFTGVITSQTMWINGCARYGLQAQKLQEGRPAEVQMFDEHHLKLKKKKVAACAVPQVTGRVVVPNTAGPGGPRDRKSPESWR